MASSTARMSEWCDVDGDHPSGRQVSRHLHIGAWFVKGDL